MSGIQAKVGGKYWGRNVIQVGLSVDTFLQDLTAEGQLVSPGQFTVDLQHARDKLGSYLLERTEQVLLKLVQTGVAAGASGMSLHRKSTSLSFSMYGVALRSEDLGQILSYLLRPAEQEHNRALRHLAVAVNTAVSTRPSAITLASWDEKQGELFRWNVSGREREDWRPAVSGRKVTLFQLNRTLHENRSNLWHFLSQRDILGMLLNTRKGWDQDRLMLADMGRWCPVPLSLNGSRLEDPVMCMARDRLTLVESRVPHHNEFWLPLLPGSRGVRRCARMVGPWPGHEFPGPHPGGILVAGKIPYAATREVSSELELLVDGIITDSYPIEGVPPGSFVKAIVAVEDCPLDLPGLHAVRGPALQQKTRSILSQAGELFPLAGLGAAPGLYVDWRG